MKQACGVVIGGGTGSFSVLSGLKYSLSDIVALVSMADDGGSSGLLRDDMGVLPPGDVRKCLVALSDAPLELRNLFNYRYESGALQGHSFGNIFLSTVEKMTNNFAEAVRITSDILRIHGQVVPITLNDVRLVITWPDGTSVHGESAIDTMHFAQGNSKPMLHLDPVATLNPAAEAALLRADIIVIAPGDLYTSIGALLAVPGVKEVIARASAKLVYVSNLVSKPGHTDGFTVADHANEITRFLGGARQLDYVIYNTAALPTHLVDKYSREGEVPVLSNVQELQAAPYTAIGADLVSSHAADTQAGDPLKASRSYIRHDSHALAKVIENLI
jgi:uncharacterized cofD-like protein